MQLSILLGFIAYQYFYYFSLGKTNNVAGYVAISNAMRVNVPVF